MHRAYSILDVKNVDERKRTFSGIATTPALDRMNDSVSSLGAKFAKEIPLLHAHRSDMPIGFVRLGKATKSGIPFEATIPIIHEPPTLKERVDVAFGEVLHGLVKAVSIGFRPLSQPKYNDKGGYDFDEVEIMELSTVAIPAHQDALIHTVKSIDRELRKAAGVPEPEFIQIKQFDTNVPAATGHMERSANTRPGATGISENPIIKSPPGKGTTTMNANAKIGEQIAALEETRKGKALRLEEIQSTASAAGRTKDENERKEFDTLRNEIKGLDLEITDLKDVEALHTVGTVKAVAASNAEEGAAARTLVPAVAKKKEEPGLAWTRLLKVKAVSRLELMPVLDVAAKMYGKDSQTYHIIKTNEVLPGTAASGNWAYDLISQEGAALADFVEWLRAGMIVGKFGQNGIPALNRIGFYQPYATQTAGGAGAWVGEAKPKPLTSFDFDRSTLTPLKMAIISVLTERNIRYSDPNSDVIIRDQLGKALIQLEDETFITAGNSGSSNVKPASITNGAASIVATGTGDADDIRLDIRALVHKFTGTPSFNPPRNGVLIMSTDNAMALGTMTNALGQPEFPGIGMDGGRLLGFPIIVSDYAGSIVALVNASDIYYADEGGVTVDFSREASLEMKDDGHLSQDGAAGVGASLVSMFQNNMVAYRAEKTVNWKRRRSTAVAYLSSVTWGGAVPAS